ncbi:MAG: VOC family protein [Propioniciclava sp.]
MQRIIPNLWFDHVAAEAARFYCATFPNSRVLATQYYPDEGLPDWQADFAGLPLTIDFELNGCRFTGINAGPEFRPNASISFFLNFDPASDPHAREHLDQTWAALTADGQVRMDLQEYPFSRRYGWVEDRYGVHWQLILTNPDGEPRPFIVPCLTFGPAADGGARAALQHYAATFDSTDGTLVLQPPGSALRAGAVLFADVRLEGVWFAAMDAADLDAPFSCGVSLAAHCADQAEIDRLWAALSSVPEAEQCGWCVDRYGLSWQILPANLDELMSAPDATAKLYAMKKIEISAFG